MSETKARVRRRWDTNLWSAPSIFGIGVLLIPGLLSILAHSWGAPAAADYVRMAFATVSGSTVAIATVVGLWVFFLRRRSPYLFWYGLGAAVMVAIQLALISGAATVLLEQLGLS